VAAAPSMMPCIASCPTRMMASDLAAATGAAFSWHSALHPATEITDAIADETHMRSKLSSATGVAAATTGPNQSEAQESGWKGQRGALTKNFGTVPAHSQHEDHHGCQKVSRHGFKFSWIHRGASTEPPHHEDHPCRLRACRNGPQCRWLLRGTCMFGHPSEHAIRRSQPHLCSALAVAPAIVKADKEVVLAAVRLWGLALEHADATLQADKGVVLAAVQNHGFALQYAATDLQADKEVVLAAVTSPKPCQNCESSDIETLHTAMETKITKAVAAAATTSQHLKVANVDAVAADLVKGLGDTNEAVSGLRSRLEEVACTVEAKIANANAAIDELFKRLDATDKAVADLRKDLQEIKNTAKEKNEKYFQEIFRKEKCEKDFPPSLPASGVSATDAPHMCTPRDDDKEENSKKIQAAEDSVATLTTATKKAKARLKDILTAIDHDNDNVVDKYILKAALDAEGGGLRTLMVEAGLNANFKALHECTFGTGKMITWSQAETLWHTLQKESNNFEGAATAQVGLHRHC